MLLPPFISKEEKNVRKEGGSGFEENYSNITCIANKIQIKLMELKFYY